MMNKEIKKQSRELYSKSEYNLALKAALRLSDNESVNFLIKESFKNKWFQNFDFCNCIAQDKDLLQTILNFDRADEILYKHFIIEWKLADNITPIPFQRKVVEYAPELFIKVVRVSQSFLKNSWYSEINLNSKLRIHQKVWGNLHKNELELWEKVNCAFTDILKSDLNFYQILIDLVIALEVAYSKNMQNANSQFLSQLYSSFIQILISLLPEGFEIPHISQTEIKKLFLKSLDSRKINSEIEEIFQALISWKSFINILVDPYCFDLKIEPKEELGKVSYNRSSKDYYKWELDGKRYEINRLDYMSDAIKVSMQQIESITKNFPKDATSDEFEYEFKCQTQYLALNYFMKDLTLSKFPGGNNLNSERFFQPLIAASNMFEYLIDNHLYSKISEHNIWFDTYKEMYKEIPSHLGIDNFPFLFLKPEQLYEIHDSQSKIEDDKKTKAKTLYQPFCYTAKSGVIIDRFSLNYDVLKKPFLLLGDYVFCPIHFFAKNDWFYAITQNALERLNYQPNNKFRKETASEMEIVLQDAFKKAGFKPELFYGHEFTNEEGDIDIKATDDQDTILIQLKRTKLRLNLKDAYFEYINTDRKASRQLNNVEKHFKNQSGKKSKWIVTTSYENVYTKIDGCLKVNYFDLLTILKSFAYLPNTTIKDLVNRINSDSQIKDVLSYKALLEPQKLDIPTFNQYNKSGLFTTLAPFKEEYEIYRSVNIPLPLVEPNKYKEVSFATDNNSSKYINKYSEALDADKEGDFKKAHKLFESCLKEHPYDFNTLSAQANVLINMKRYSEAFIYFEKALNVCPNDLFVNRNYAIALLEVGNIEKAMQIYEQIQKDYYFVDHQILKPIENMPPEIVSQLLK